MLTTKKISFRRAFELALIGQRVRATLWSKEYYLSFAQGELWLEPGHRPISIAQLAIWRQLYTSWEKL